MIWHHAITSLRACKITSGTRVNGGSRSYRPEGIDRITRKILHKSVVCCHKLPCFAFCERNKDAIRNGDARWGRDFNGSRQEWQKRQKGRTILQNVEQVNRRVPNRDDLLPFRFRQDMRNLGRKHIRGDDLMQGLEKRSGTNSQMAWRGLCPRPRRAVGVSPLVCDSRDSFAARNHNVPGS